MHIVWRASPFSLIVQPRMRKWVWYNCYTGFVQDLTSGISNQIAERAKKKTRVTHMLKGNTTNECNYNCSGRI